MTASETTLNNKGFFRRFPRWFYWLLALLIVELIIILGVVYGYVRPKNQQLKDSFYNCNSHYTRQYGFCESSCKSGKLRCENECDKNNLQCIIDCGKKYDNCPYDCTKKLIDNYDYCSDSAIYRWGQ